MGATVIITRMPRVGKTTVLKELKAQAAGELLETIVERLG